MLRRIVCPALAILVTAAMSALTVGTADGSEPPAGANAGPPYTFETELMSEYAGLSLKDQVRLVKTKHGYVFHSGQQNSHLVVTLVDGGVRFADTGTERFKNLAARCHKKRVSVGVAAVCKVPATISVNKPLLIEIWPRLGNDYSDTSSLPATFAVTVLGDKGSDTAHFGAGWDFFNGFSGRDRVWGGGGNDWIRPGIGNDVIDAGAGNDDVVSNEGRDTVRGGDGVDRLWTGEGDDRLWGGDGADFLLCGSGHDTANADGADRVSRECESVVHG